MAVDDALYFGLSNLYEDEVQSSLLYAWLRSTYESWQGIEC